MNKKGITKSEKEKTILYKIRHSYIYKLVTKILSVILTLILIAMLVVGGTLFYYNQRASRAQKEGINYTPPFGLYTIISGSMEPNISVYDVVATREVGTIEDVKVGDVITFISTWDLNFGVTVTHRVIAINTNAEGKIELTTKGDNNQVKDGAVVTEDNLIGKVIFLIPQLGRVQFFLATKLGWFIVVFIPALAVIIYDLLKILKLLILKNNISNLDTPKDSEKIFYGDELLENRTMQDIDLETTMKVDTTLVNETINREPINTYVPKLEPIVKEETVTNTGDDLPVITNAPVRNPEGRTAIKRVTRFNRRN